MDAEARAELRKIRDDYKKTFLRSRHGKRVLRDLMEFGGLLASAPDTTSAVALARFEGRRDVINKILAALNKDSYAGLYELEQQGVETTDIFDEEK